MKNKENDIEQKVLAKLDRITKLLEKLFILQAAKAGIKQLEIRKILKVDLGRVNKISKFVKEHKQFQDK